MLRYQTLTGVQMGRTRLCLSVLVLFEVICCVRTLPQDVAGATPVLRRGSNLVLVPTRVITRSGEPVFGLSASDFILTDDGIEQTLTLEEGTDSQPLALVILVQTGGAGGRRLDSYRRLGPLLDPMAGAIPHRLAVVGFDSEPHIEAEFTPDLDKIAGGMENLQPGDGGAAILG